VDASELIERVAASGLRGRGGGWFPVARKWAAVRVEGGEPLAIANGAEGEPGSVKDRHVMVTRPGDVLRGLAVAAQAVGAREAIVFLKRSFDRPATALEEALRTADLGGLSVSIRRGDDSYITGEETALLESLEGRRPWPRPKPPLPAAVGYQGRPTLIQNVETLARVPAAVANPEAYRTTETTLVSLWGDVRRPGVYDVPLRTPVRDVIERFGGGATSDIGLVFPAGPSAPPLTPDQLAVPLHPDDLREAGSALGTASVLVVGGPMCPLSIAASLAAFFERESCGQCPPCLQGSRNLSRVLRVVEVGEGRARDLHDLAEAAGFMADHGYCAHGRTAAAAVTGLLRRVPSVVEAHLADRRCAREGPSRDPFHPASPERAAIEATLA
jgi:NADH-quinone oxidoreductase subunit F